MIKLQNISLKLDENQIFDNFSLSIKTNQNTVITGASGRGKSTLLKLIGGIQQVDSGKILINNHELNNNSLEEVRKQLIWIPQNINLPVNTGLELMTIMDVSDNLEAIQQSLKTLLLNTAILKKDFSAISGGEKQRIIIAICVSLSGTIILMDEPSSSLDIASKQALIKLINNIENKTIVSVSHDNVWIDNFKHKIEL